MNCLICHQPLTYTKCFNDYSCHTSTAICKRSSGQIITPDNIGVINAFHLEFYFNEKIHSIVYRDNKVLIYNYNPLYRKSLEFNHNKIITIGNFNEEMTSIISRFGKLLLLK